MAGQQQKKRSWRASVECARPIGEKNNAEGVEGMGRALWWRKGWEIGDNSSSSTVTTLKN